jgi:Protein of unknown function (DUF3572)
MTPRDSSNSVDQDHAETIAAWALSFLVSRPDDMGRFFALTGIRSDTIRQNAAEPGFLAGVLDYLLGDEALLTAFAAEAGIPPGRVQAVRHRLDDA